MELNELKRAWGKVAASKDQSHFVDTDEIRQLLKRRGSGILSILERNVRTGFWLLGLFILLTIADQIFPYELIFPAYPGDQLPTPPGLKLTGLVVSSIMVLTFMLFVIRYKRLNVRLLATSDMKDALRKVIQLLDTFKKEFYLALIVFSCAAFAGFVMGVWKGIEMMPQKQSVSQFKLITGELLIVMIMIAIIVLIFYIFHKGFNALYGQYRQQLIRTLNELEETEE